MFSDTREPMIEVALQLLIVVLDYDMEHQQIMDHVNNPDHIYEVIKRNNNHINGLFQICKKRKEKKM